MANNVPQTSRFKERLLTAASVILVALAIAGAVEQFRLGDHVAMANWLVFATAIVLAKAFKRHHEATQSKFSGGAFVSAFFLQMTSFVGNMVWFTTGPHPVLSFYGVALAVWMAPTIYIFYLAVVHAKKTAV